jgi:hypothetical protein
MGFIVSQSIEHTIYGGISSFYSRIENYRLDKGNGELFLTVSSYYDKDSAEMVNTRDLTQPGWFAYPVIGMIQVNGSDFDMNELNYYRVRLTSSYYTYEDIMEEQLVREEVTYYEFDESGSMTEVTREEDVYKFVKVGETPIEGTRIDFSPISSSFFEFCYGVVKKRYLETFGEDTIITDV